MQDLWRKAIKQQILLLRMDKENQRIIGRCLGFLFSLVAFGINFPHPTEHEEQLAERRLKLDYNSLVSSSEATLQTWEGNLDPCSLPLHVFYMQVS